MKINSHFPLCFSHKQQKGSTLAPLLIRKINPILGGPQAALPDSLGPDPPTAGHAPLSSSSTSLSHGSAQSAFSLDHVVPALRVASPPGLILGAGSSAAHLGPSPLGPTKQAFVVPSRYASDSAPTVLPDLDVGP